MWAVYPTVDALLLALAGHLAYRLGNPVPAMTWIIGSLVLVLLVDLVNSLVAISSATGEHAVVTGWYMFFFFGLAAAASHPSVPRLAHRPAPGERSTTGQRRTALIVLTISPVLVSTLVPVGGWIDTVVRVTLVTLLLGLLFLRLSVTMLALSKAESDSHYRATHDQLTGLLNRAEMFNELEQRLVNNAAAGRSTAVLFLDCDDFKYINDTWGHGAGDTLLRDIASRLPRRLGPEPLLARQGGDEFVVVCAVDGLAEAVALARLVRSFFDEPVRIMTNRTHTVTPSIGIALAEPGETVTAEALVGRADVAMYEAKTAGRGRYVVFDDDLARRSRMKSAVADRIGEALRQEAFSLVLQPIMAGADYATIIGWEALARWHDPDLGEVSPAEFIPLAEQHGFINELGEFVLRQACRELALLRELFRLSDVSMFVNVSPAQLLQPDFVDVVRRALESAGLPPDALWLEVTETLHVDKGPEVTTTLVTLREAGVHLCIDDFGTGYASLSRIMQLPVDCVKIDSFLVARVGEDTTAQRQLGAVIDLVRSLGIEHVVAEGVETSAQEAAVRQLGCPMIQGFLYGRPKTAQAMLAARGMVLDDLEDDPLPTGGVSGARRA